jgi:hypothetical protein
MPQHLRELVIACIVLSEMLMARFLIRSHAEHIHGTCLSNPQAIRSFLNHSEPLIEIAHQYEVLFGVR